MAQVANTIVCVLYFIIPGLVKPSSHMARANLVVDDELLNAFMSAGESEIRWLKAELEDVHIKLTDKGTGSSSASNDLSSMKQSALQESPCFVLFKVSSGGARSWVLIAYVPEGSRVRSRMLYASGQEDVKQALGHTNFLGSVHVSEVDDLDLESLMSSRKRDLTDAPLTEEEIYAKEEVAYLASPSDAKANAMGLVPFSFTNALDSKLREFALESIDLVEMYLGSGESVELGSTTKESTLSCATIFTAGPRFYVLRHPTSGRIYFIFSCPTQSKIKDRMVYSTAKATIHHRLTEVGIDINKVLEIGDTNDFDDLLKLHETPDENAGKIVFKEISKPARPGRGKARLPNK